METENPTKENAPPAAPALDLDALAKKVTASLRPAVREMVKKQVAGKAAANPGATLSEDALDKLHTVYEETGNEELGKILDEVCTDPDCQDGDDED